MKWAERLETRARALQREIGADDFDDVVGRGDLLDGLCGDAAHAVRFSLVCRAADGKLNAAPTAPPPQRSMRLMRSFVFSLLLIVCLLLRRRRRCRRARRFAEAMSWWCPLHGEVSPPMFLFLRRVLKAAESKGAAAIIFEMNTYGGRLDSAEEITNLLNRATIPTYTFINTNAGSAGALIALATQHIYMAPVSAIGAAAPILASGEDLGNNGAGEDDFLLVRVDPRLRESQRPQPRCRRGVHGQGEGGEDRRARSFIRKGSLLTLSAQEATARIDGKPVLAEGIADSVADLMQKAGLKGEVVSFKPTGFERLAFWITALAPLLLLGGNALRLSWNSRFPAPACRESSAVNLLRAVFPRPLFRRARRLGSGCAFCPRRSASSSPKSCSSRTRPFSFGVIGVFLMLGALLWAMVDRYPGQTFFPTGPMLRVPVLNLLIAMIAAVDRDRDSRALPAAHEPLPAIRSLGGHSLGSVPRRPFRENSAPRWKSHPARRAPP